VAEALAHARLEPDALDPARELQQLLAAAVGDGAVVSFVGLTRPEAGEVDSLVLEHHATLTEASLKAIAEEALTRFGVGRTWVVHRCGTVAAGQPIVFAGAAAQHRRDAFAAADYLMDRLKTDAVFWKKEQGLGTSRWIEPTEDDYAARSRWSQ
jgi:molybdopterin synthase catalytic subunit